jgi:hypothetical protein
MWKGPMRVSQRKEPGAPERAGSFEKGRPPVLAIPCVSLCPSVFHCSLSVPSRRRRAATVKIPQPSPPGKSRVPHLH